MGVLDGNPTDEPMHYGEVFGVWSTLLATNGMIAAHQIHLNHTGDQDLANLIQESIQQAQRDVKEIETLLKDNGIGLPPAPPERPRVQVEDIPAGARMQDPEIAASLSAEVAAGLVSCSTMMGKSIREDIIAMYGQFHTQKAAMGGKLLRLNKQKGWLVPPPLHHKPTNN